MKHYALGLLFLVLGVSSPSRAQSSVDRVAVEMAKSADAPTRTSILRNMGMSTPELKGALDAWTNALQVSIHEAPDRVSLLMFVMGLAELFEGGQFQNQKAQELSRRIAHLSEDKVKEFQSAFPLSAADAIDRRNAAVSIIRCEWLFEGDKLRESQWPSAMARLRSIPKDTIADWSASAKLERRTAAVSLFRVDGLFRDDTFDTAMYTAALPQARKAVDDKLAADQKEEEANRARAEEERKAKKKKRAGGR